MSTQLFFLPFWFSSFFILLVFMLSVLFLVVVIHAFLCSLRVVSMDQFCLQCWQILFLFLTQSVNIISRCKALCIVISFLVLWSICLSSFLVHFKNGLEYLMREPAQVFIPFIRFLLYSFGFE